MTGLCGLLLIAIAWPTSWLQLFPLATAYVFFLQWLGYCLVVDTLVLQRRGTSLLTRSPSRFVGLFAVSAPIWWLFEGTNRLVQNWHYVGAEVLGPLGYFVIASVCFSTVVPAIFETAELAATFSFVRRASAGPIVCPTRRLLAGAMLFGFISLLAMALWPRYTFPLAWLCLFLLVDPLNYLQGRPSLTASLARGDWRPVFALWVAGIVCGFFWEMWNFWAFPKWVYTIPVIDFLHVFEMPILGYSGYLPFAMEVFALYHLVAAIGGRRSLDYVKLAMCEPECASRYCAEGTK
jgi:hypothetical protein